MAYENGKKWMNSLDVCVCVCACRCWFLWRCWHTSLQVVLHAIRFGHVHIYQKYFFRFSGWAIQTKLWFYTSVNNSFTNHIFCCLAEFWYAVVSVGVASSNAMEWDGLEWRRHWTQLNSPWAMGWHGPGMMVNSAGYMSIFDWNSW